MTKFVDKSYKAFKDLKLGEYFEDTENTVICQKVSMLQDNTHCNTIIYKVDQEHNLIGVKEVYFEPDEEVYPLQAILEIF